MAVGLKRRGKALPEYYEKAGVIPIHWETAVIRDSPNPFFFVAFRSGGTAGMLSIRKADQALRLKSAAAERNVFAPYLTLGKTTQLSSMFCCVRFVGTDVSSVPTGIRRSA